MEEEQLRKLLKDYNFEFIEKLRRNEFGHIYTVKRDNATQ